MTARSQLARFELQTFGAAAVQPACACGGARHGMCLSPQATWETGSIGLFGLSDSRHAKMGLDSFLIIFT